MSSIAQKLASKLEEWESEVSREVESLVAGIIELADLNLLDLARSRRVEQEVLDLLNEPIAHLAHPSNSTPIPLLLYWW
jgi:hypothetical protein